MKMIEIRERALCVGVAPGKMRKAEVIRSIQRSEENQACFGADWRFDCRQFACCWREDCLTRITR